MVVAGATAGVYELKTMAYETTECLLRAGMSDWSCRQHPVLILCQGATLIMSYFTPQFLDWLDEDYV